MQTSKKEMSKNIIADWADESAKLQTARRNKGIYEVSNDDKHYPQGDC